MPRIAFYGDDFTGASDALAQYYRNGLRGRLYFAVPSADEIAGADDDVIGVAGVARSLPTEAMDAEVLPFFRARWDDARVVQYKVCSTFDSSPTVGSIGHVAALARAEGYRGPYPVLPAQPHFGRYTLFANHFANYGDAIYRLDRHPTMANHPSTPMREADLRRVLADQGVTDATSFDITQLHAPDAADRLRGLIAANPSAIVCDALDDDDLRALGRVMLQAWPRRMFAIGSGGLSFAIGSALGGGAAPQEDIPPVERVLVLSGSMAPQTAAQVAWAAEHGWHKVPIDPRSLDLSQASLDAFARAVLECHRNAPRGAIAFSAGGGVADGRVDPALLGATLGGVLARAFASGEVERAVVCGGDTSSYAIRATGARSLTIARLLIVAGAMCRLDAADRALDGKLVMLKGGQVGNERLFETVRTGAASVATTFA